MNGYRIYLLHKDGSMGCVRRGDGSGDNLWPGVSPLDALTQLANRYTWYKGDRFFVGERPGVDPLDFIQATVKPQQPGANPLAAVPAKFYPY